MLSGIFHADISVVEQVRKHFINILIISRRDKSEDGSLSVLQSNRKSQFQDIQDADKTDQSGFNLVARNEKELTFNKLNSHLMVQLMSIDAETGVLKHSFLHYNP